MGYRDDDANPDKKLVPSGALKGISSKWASLWWRALRCLLLRSLAARRRRRKQLEGPACDRRPLPGPTTRSEAKRLRDAYLSRLGIDTEAVGATITAYISQTAPSAGCHRSCLGDSRSGRSSLSSSTSGGGSSSTGVVGHEGGQACFRLHYLRQLSYRRVWLPHGLRPPRKQTVIIFDWDDTLLCTSFLSSLEGHVAPAALQALPELRRIGATARRVLELAQRLGLTYIITNAAEGWVQWAAYKFLPELLPALGRTQVISARSMYEARYPGAAGEWKARAFVEVRRSLDPEPITNLVSLGDSQHEADAANLVGRAFANVTVKTVKFWDSPTPLELLQELSHVEQGLHGVVAHGRASQWGPLECARLRPRQLRGAEAPHVS